jgi:phosphoglycolate phosphatase-like HAD superfamily hydrolase
MGGEAFQSHLFLVAQLVWSLMGEKISKFSYTKAILFDMHLTITEVDEDFVSLIRRAANIVGIDLRRYTDQDVNVAIRKCDEWFKSYQIEHDVGIHFGNEIEHWTQVNRMMFESLGIDSLADEVLISVEKEWRELLKTWETLRPDAKATMMELHERGYKLGICTRRPDDPTSLLKEWGILDIISTVRWTSVPGYAKPYPFTLILAADDIGINPLRCAYVGNSFDMDMVAAKRAGMLPILSIWADVEEATKVKDDTVVISEITGLLDLFDKSIE